MKKFLMLIFVFTFNYAFACSEDGKEGFLPENDLNIPANFKSLNGMDEMIFNDIIEKVETVYEPIVHNLGGTLFVRKLWANGTVNALATRSGKIWYVHMYGGLARHEATTPDAFALVLCHELGHHIGGAPLKAPGFLTSEGQADYWGVLKCTREIWKNDDNVAAIKDQEVPAIIEQKCSQQYKDIQEKSLCIRSGLAGISLANLLAAVTFDKKPDINVSSQQIVKSTYVQHPKAQCRLDTFFAGALCTENENTPVSRSDETKGVCLNSLVEKVQPIGSRPLCWYSPKL